MSCIRVHRDSPVQLSRIRVYIEIPDLRIFLKYGIPPLVPLFISLCAGIIVGNYLPVFPRLLIVIPLFFLIIPVFYIVFIVKQLQCRNDCPEALERLIIKTIQIIIKQNICPRFCTPAIFIILSFISGYCLVHSAIFPELAQNHISNFTDKGILEITGKISSRPEEFFYTRPEKTQSNARGSRTRFNLEVETVQNVIEESNEKSAGAKAIQVTEKNGQDWQIRGVQESIRARKNTLPTQRQVTGMVQVNVYNPLEQYEQGDIVQFKGKLLSIRNFNNPGRFDYVRYMQTQNIWGRVSVNGKMTLRKRGTIDLKDNGHALAGTTKSESLNIAAISKGLLRTCGFHIKTAMDLCNKTIMDSREIFSAHIFKLIENSDSRAILCALTTGQKEFISKELTRDFSVTGGSHILAISGLHLSIVATLFFFIFNGLLSCFKWVLIRGWSKKGAALLTIFPIVGYAVLSGYSDATQRAMIMIIIFMTAAVIERESDGFNSLAAAGIVILLLDPLSLFMVSFQLSFSAVFFILMGLSLAGRYRYVLAQESQSDINCSQAEYALVSKDFNIKFQFFFRRFISGRFSRKLAGFVFISICAIAGTQILVMHYFNIFSFSGLLTNLILVPGIGFIALPLGLAALFAHPFSAQVSGILIECSGVVLAPCINAVRAIAALPWSHVETFTPDMVEIVCYYIFVFAIFITAKSWLFVVAGSLKKKDDAFFVSAKLLKKRHESMKLKEKAMMLKKKNMMFKEESMTLKEESIINKILFKGGLFAVSVIFFIILVHESLWIKKRFFNKNLDVTVLDVGQSNCALVQMPRGKTMLVDGGGFSYEGKFDTGEHIVAPFLRQKRIMSLDAVVLTHPDSDHMNGLVYIFEHFKVNRFIKNCDHQESRAYMDLMSGVKKNGSQVYIIDEKAKSIQIGMGSLSFFHPLEPCSDQNSGAENTNNNSVVLKVIFKNNSILFPGDIMKSAEQELVRRHASFLKSDILVAPHHGSAGSSTDFFLDKVAPESIIISCGWQNRFGFPRSIVLNRYQKRGIQILRTDLNGAVNVCSDGSQWKTATFF
ncbi:MAG: DNA internalization-related competence protein ComEC/Rec2 [Desulfamplus sp.]|nr:DNA internalization-related competence protein ComEC/Rec2 [Desulfamplus sp.]